MAENVEKAHTVSLCGGTDIAPVFINETQATQIVPFSKYWFQKKRWKGDGPPYVKVDGRVFYDREELLAWFRGHRQTSTTKPADGVS